MVSALILHIKYIFQIDQKHYISTVAHLKNLKTRLYFCNIRYTIQLYSPTIQHSKNYKTQVVIEAFNFFLSIQKCD